ncbi:hypothetical protein GCM10010123_17470 [Pilimelia anulata]|uniref:DUF998 domain-containing protein n=1 Tax=Pilimelia anulata TaxID=53371 RepID=A0A8J3FBY5_9ACTN|nr:hypothetical protein [Pilimelia anulata]GGJ88389.1 hypothetical protein GCM10010123_17470 [Pilimelia anulata]
MDGGDEARGLLRTAIGDGRPPLLLTAAGLMFAGGFAVFLAATGQFLPHDVWYLGITPDELCALADCRVVGFLIHDRAAFGGALFAIGGLYAYLVLFPLRRGAAWAWWILAASGAAGFASFLTYLDYGYLDTWHAVGTALLLVIFVVGMVRSRRSVRPWRGPLSMVADGRLPEFTTLAALGRATLLAGAGGRRSPAS